MTLRGWMDGFERVMLHGWMHRRQNALRETRSSHASIPNYTYAHMLVVCTQTSKQTLTHTRKQT